MIQVNLKLFLIICLFESLTSVSLSCDFSEYSSDEWAFVRTVALSHRSPTEKLKSISLACREMDTTYWAGTFAQYHQGVVVSAASSVIWPFFRLSGFAPAAFSNMKKTEVQKQFMNELLSYKKIEDPIVRIQKVYEFVGRSQGEYDKSGGAISYRSPEALLNKAASDGVGGQCRDYALLLYWSLLQVARHPDDEKTGLGGLSEKSFSLEPVHGNGKFNDKYVGFHEWVRVNLPRKNPKTGQRYFEKFDLDATWYRKDFTPLMPRHQNFSNKEIIDHKNKCDRLVSCLSGESLQDSISKLEKIFKPPSCPR